MADIKITNLPLGTDIADDDQLLYIDVSDTTAGPLGTDKRILIGTARTALETSNLKESRQNREAIEAVYKAQGYNNVFFFEDGFTYTESNDVGVYEDGTAWTYADAGALPVTVAAGTVPSEGVYKAVKVVLPPFETVSDMEGAAYLSTLPEGTRVRWQGYYTQSDGGSNWGVLKFGAHAADGGSIFSIDASTYIEANLVNNRLSKKFGVKYDFNVTTIAGTDNTLQMQRMIDYDPKIKLERGRLKCGTLKVPQGFNISGQGSRHQKDYASAIYAELDNGRDLFEYEHVGGYPSGDIQMKDILLVNIKGILPGGNLNSPTEYQEIIDSNNRAFWGVGTQNFFTAGWIQKKTGGFDCPVVNIQNVQCLNFFCAVDVSSWMITVKNLRTRFCGIGFRHYGTSLAMDSSWFEYVLLGGLELQSNYSHVRSTAFIEQKVEGFWEEVVAVKLSGGSVVLDSCGFEGGCRDLIEVNWGDHSVRNLIGYTADQSRGQPMNIFSKIGRGTINIENSFDFRWFTRSYMSVYELQYMDGINHVTPIIPHAYSYANESEVSWPTEPLYAYKEIRDETTDDLIRIEGVFGVMTDSVNGVTILPYNSRADSYAKKSSERELRADWLYKDSIRMSSEAARVVTCTVNTENYEIGNQATIEAKFTPSLGISTATGNAIKFDGGVDSLTGIFARSLTSDLSDSTSTNAVFSHSTEVGVSVDSFFKFSFNANNAGWGAAERSFSSGVWEISARGVVPYNVDKDRRYFMDVATS